MTPFPFIMPLAAAREPVVPGWDGMAAETFANLLGPWVAHEAGFGITWSTLVAAGALLVLALLADAALRLVARRRIRDREARAAEGSAARRERFYWTGRILQAAVSPVALLVWIAGGAAALDLVFHDLAHRALAVTALDVLAIARAVALLAALLWLASRVSAVLAARAAQLTVAEDPAWNRALVPLVARTVRFALPLAVLVIGVSWLPASDSVKAVAGNAVSLVVIAVVALLLRQAAHAVEAFVLARFGGERGDVYLARRVRTQVTVLRKIVVVVIAVFTVASMLMVFDSVRQFGTSILASAGVVGIIIGFAAQRSIATLLAGIQIALTRPIRIDDVVIVEGEWGRIEDITLTFVIVCIWDQRRLILPITWFMERPFENWTSTSSDILGTVFLHVDYTMPIQPLREELDRILAQSEFWDGKLRSILVTDTKESTLVVRAMASASDGDNAWFLRCEIREKLVGFIRENYPQCLPRVRAELQSPGQA